MQGKIWVKLAITVPLLVALVALDTVSALAGVPLLVIALGVGALVTDPLRVRLRKSGRAGLAMLPFMAAALVVLFAFCRGRELSQGILFAVTVAVVFDVLLVALAAIGEAGKRGARGMLEFVAIAGMGLVVGLALSLLFSLEGITRLGGTSLAEP